MVSVESVTQQDSLNRISLLISKADESVISEIEKVRVRFPDAGLEDLLFDASYYHRYVLAKALLRMGAKPYLSLKEQSALDYAIDTHDITLIDLFLTSALNSDEIRRVADQICLSNISSETGKLTGKRKLALLLKLYETTDEDLKEYHPSREIKYLNGLVKGKSEAEIQKHLR